MTNTIHHQAVNQMPEGYLVTGRSRDGIIEAVESTRHTFVLGVQWHPEKLLEKNRDWAKLFTAFVDKALANKTKKGQE